MIIAKIDPSQSQELTFDIKVEGTKEEPSDIRFVIESQTVDGQEVQDTFSIICRAIRTADSIKVVVPRLLNLFKAGTYRARLEVVLENRLFVPVNEEILIEEAISVSAPINKPVEVVEHRPPEVTATLTSVINSLLDAAKPVEEEIQEPVKPAFDFKLPERDSSWKEKGFGGIRNPFKSKS
jgi:hypothetical protein